MSKLLTPDRIASYRANGHIDLQPRPQQDFGAAETQRHDVSFKAYLDSFYEQLALVEKDIPADALS